jgi:hypothetical protein
MCHEAQRKLSSRQVKVPNSPQSGHMGRGFQRHQKSLNNNLEGKGMTAQVQTNSMRLEVPMVRFRLCACTPGGRRSRRKIKGTAGTRHASPGFLPTRKKSGDFLLALLAHPGTFCDSWSQSVLGGVGLLRCVGRRSAVVFGVLSNTMHVLSCRHSKQASITHCHGIRRGQYCQPRTPIKPVHSPN